MAELNLTQASTAVGISRQTLYQHLKNGKVSATVNHRGDRVIHTSELIRVYGELKNVPNSVDTLDTSSVSTGQDLTPPDSRHDTVDTDLHCVIKALEDQVQFLKGELSREREENTSIKNESMKEKDRLLTLVERQTNLITDQRPRVGFFGRIFGMATA